MLYIYLLVVFFLLAGHLICELLTIFFRYNYAALSKHMAGAAVANYFAIGSRGFVSLYAIVVAYLIERLNLSLAAYSVCVSSALLFAGFASILLARGALKYENERPTILFGKEIKHLFRTSAHESIPPINIFLIFVLGVQFIAMSLAYALCMIFVENRLIIISIAPALSMLGTVTAAVFIEPKFAEYIDATPKCGFEVSSRYILARGISFFVSALAFLSLVLFDY